MRGALDALAFPLALLRCGEVTWANPAFERTLGRDRSELIGADVVEVFGPMLAPDTRGLLAGIREDADDRLPEDLWLHPDANGRRFRLRFGRVVDREILVAVVEEEAGLCSGRLTEELVAAAASLWSARSEQALFEKAADELHRLGFEVEILLTDGEAFVTGPVRPAPAAPASERTAREKRPAWDEVLARRCMTYEIVPERRQRNGLPARAGTALLPVFAWEQPVAVVRVERSPLDRADAAALELFASHLGAAAENVRHHLHAEERLELLIQLQQELVQHERLAAVGETSAVFISEMRGPLGAIMNAVALLRRDAAASHDAKMLLRIVDEEAQRLATLINDLFHSTAALNPRRFRFDLAELASRVLSRVEASLHPQVTLIGPELTAPMEVDADPELLQLAIENLVRNAINVCPPNSTIQVGVQLLADGVALLVDDSGPGIPEDEAARIFEPFFTTRASGAGLGLAVVRRVVEAHHGRIQVTRSPLGGARFELILP